MSPRRLLVFLLASVTVLRLLLIGAVELSPDEAYYTMWSERMDISYYSKGPGVAAAIWLGTHLFGFNEWGVRLLSPLLALGTAVLMWLFARKLYGESVAFWTVLLLHCIPIFHVGGLVMTIDPLSMFFWMAALYTFWLALERTPSFSRWWPITGALVGAGFLCKYTNAMQLLSIVLLLLVTPRYRKEFLRPGLWSLLGVFLLFLIPPVVWNARHDWITVSHISARGGLEKAFKIDLGEWFTFLGAHFGVYSPLIFGGFLAALWWGLGKARLHAKPRFLIAFAAPLLIMYFFLALRQAGEANWTAPASLSLAVLAVALWHEKALAQRWAAKFCIAALSLGLLMSIIVIDVDGLRRLGIPLPYQYDPSARLRGWKSAAEIVTRFRGAYEKSTGQNVFLIANKYQTAAILGNYMQPRRAELPGHPPVYIPESQAIENQFSFWSRYDEVEQLDEMARSYLESAEAKTAATGVKEEVVRALGQLSKSSGSDDPRYATLRYELARALHVALPSAPIDENFVAEQGVNMFAGRTALYITDRTEEKAPTTIKDGFERVEMIACIDLYRRGLPLRQLRIFACTNYRGARL